MVSLSVHKQNPFQAATDTKSRVWSKNGEGLKFTAKGCKDLAVGRRLKLIVAIAYGKGMVLKEAYEKMNGRFFSQFNQEHFNIAFARSGPKRNGQRLFMMNNDPSQRSNVAEGPWRHWGGVARDTCPFTAYQRHWIYFPSLEDGPGGRSNLWKRYIGDIWTISWPRLLVSREASEDIYIIYFKSYRTKY